MRVLVLGAGYAGLTLARELEATLDDEVELVVVDDTGTHVLQHEIHRVIRNAVVAEHITVDLEDVLETATIRHGTVVDVDTDETVVSLADGDTVTYDIAAVCLGSRTAFYDLSGVADHAIPLKRIAHAERIREAVVDAVHDGGHAIVGGAGLSGIQVAGELAALRDETLDDVTVGGGDFTVTLLEMADRVAPGFPDNFQSAVQDGLRAAGVEIRTSATVDRATADAVHLADGTTLASDAFVWTGGIRGPDATDGERVRARADLRVDDNTFVVGDAADVVDADGGSVPASAQSAIREARVAAANIHQLVDHRRSDDRGAFEPAMTRFRFDSPGWLVSIGNDAVAQIGPTVVTGRAATALKATVGAGYLSGIGALRNATDLVNDELGLDPGRDATTTPPADDAQAPDIDVDGESNDPTDTD